jgi:hypothetical protein
MQMTRSVYKMAAMLGFSVLTSAKKMCPQEVPMLSVPFALKQG